jgi:hypothetical protein
MRNELSILVENPEGKIPLGRPRRGWEDAIKIYLKEIGYEDVDWIHPAKNKILDRLL